MIKRIVFLFLLFLFTIHQSVFAQVMEVIDVERLDNQNILVPRQCTPDDLIILINSSITDLKFESSWLDEKDFSVIHMKDQNQYIICHEKTRFKLIVSGPNLQSEEIDIFNLSENHVYRITSNVARGTVNIITTPDDAIVRFPTLGDSEFRSINPITNIPGRYRVIIEKPHYKSIDTLIALPRDTTRTYSFILEPLFAQLKLDIKTEDNRPFQQPAPILWIDERRISLEGLIRPVLARNFSDGVEFYHLHENNIVPLPEGNYRIKIEANNYMPYQTLVYVENGRVSTLPVMMQLIYGHITVLDSLNAQGANVYIENQLAGTIPIFEAKARVGNNRIRIEKPGFVTPQSDYNVTVVEKTNTIFRVLMHVSRQVYVESVPGEAEVHLNGNLIGFSPQTFSIPSGNHTVLVRKVGYSAEVVELREDAIARNEYHLNFNLKPNYPLIVKSEVDGLNIYFEGLNDLKNIKIANPNTSPAEVMLPYGNYHIRIEDKNDKVTYRGQIKHNANVSKHLIPNYSNHSFTALALDLMTHEASFGRIHIFTGSGLSTAILNAQYVDFKDESGSYETIMPYVFFLNWDWRLGGSVFKHLDVCLLGKAKWTPGLSVLKDLNIMGYHDAQMLTYFYGLEISTRWPYINLNCKIGRQFMEGELKIWDEVQSIYIEKGTLDILLQHNVISLGMTINGGIGRSNNMLRLWRKPLVDRVVDFF